MEHNSWVEFKEKAMGVIKIGGEIISVFMELSAMSIKYYDFNIQFFEISSTNTFLPTEKIQIRLLFVKEFNSFYQLKHSVDFYVIIFSIFLV